MGHPTLEQVLIRRSKSTSEIVNVDTPMLKLVFFSLADQIFALQGEHVREILAHCEVFFVPGLPPAVEGVINVRGEIASVIRLNEQLHLPVPERPAGHILIARGRTFDSGIRVDHVIDVADVPENCIQRTPEALPDHLRPYVLGLLDFNQRPVVLLDLEGLFKSFAGA